MTEAIATVLPDEALRAASVALWPAGAAPWTIQCDFDGTISRLDVIDTLLERFGRPGWVELESAWENGEIGSRDCMQGQVALLDMSAEELHAHLDALEIDPAFPAFVAAAEARGLPLQVVSDGLDYAIRHILRRHGLGHLPVIANRLTQSGARSWRLDSPHATADCARASGTCKCAQLADVRGAQGRVLFVGDGKSDFCVSGRADLVLAKGRLIEHCRRNGYPFAAFAGFHETLGWLDELLAERQERLCV